MSLSINSVAMQIATFLFSNSEQVEGTLEDFKVFAKELFEVSNTITRSLALLELMPQKLSKLDFKSDIERLSQRVSVFIDK